MCAVFNDLEKKLFILICSAMRGGDHLCVHACLLTYQTTPTPLSHFVRRLDLSDDNDDYFDCFDDWLWLWLVYSFSFGLL